MTIRVEQVTPDPQSPATDLLLAGVGEYLRDALDDRSRLFAAVSEGELVGAALSGPLSPWSRARWLRETERELPIRTGELKGLFVVPMWRGQGVGRRLTEARLEALRQDRFSWVLAESWVRRGADEASMSAPLLRRLGFSEHGPFPGYWRPLPDESKSAASCPDCGRRCECSALVFKRPLRV